MRAPIKPVSQRTVSFWLSAYVGLALNSPNLLRTGSSGDWVTALSALITGVALVAFAYGVFGLCAFFGTFVYRLVASLIVLASAAAAYYMIFFKVVIGYGVIVSTLTLDTDLSAESVGYKFVAWMLLAGVVPVLALWLAPLTQHAYGRRWRGMPVLRDTVLLGVGVVSIVVVGVKTITYLDDRAARAGNEYIASPGGVIAHSYVPTNWLYGLATYAYQRAGEAGAAQTLFDPPQHFDYRVPASADDLYVVFVIGETTRWDHMGMFGYRRDTTPSLAAEPNLVAMPGTSCDTATKLSLRCMFVREGGAMDDVQRTLKERNVFSVLRSTGFTSELFAMQGEAWFYNSVAAYSYELREALASTYAGSGHPIDDMVLVDQLQKSIARHPRGKHLVILHTKGSHYLYSQRYPKSFARFTPDCPGIDAACSLQQTVNAFDNSVLYVDHMLGRTIDQLRGKNAILFYSSDHGESIDEGHSFHATPRDMAPPEQFRVPFIVWASDKFLADSRNRHAFGQLQALKAGGFHPRHSQLFDSVLGCIGYTSPNGGIKQGNNWCGSAPRVTAAR
ncbi:MAG: kdo(2)-lipid A phosphoethanolamine 7''-transferase [Burkholderiaceae bacterium]